MRNRFVLPEHLRNTVPKLRLAVARRAAELHVRMRRRVASPRTLIARLGAIVALIITAAPPLLYAWVSTNQLHQHALEQAAIGARHIEVQLSRKETIDWLAQASINVLHATQGAKSSIAASWVTDTAGSTLMFQGRSAWWPELRASAPVRAAVFEGRFYVAVSTRQVFIGTLQTAVAFMVLGLAAYYCFKRLPLAALDRALQRLEAKQQELMDQKQQLQMQNLRFDAALNNMTQGLCMFDGKQELVVCNASYAKMYGLTDDLMTPGTSFRAIMEHRIAAGLHAEKSAEEYVREVLERMVDDRPITKVRELADGRVLAVKQRRMADGGWISTHEDITEYRRIEARVAHMARHDVLTDLPNRLLLRERLVETLDSERKGGSLAVLCLDLDRFKEINDTLGHTRGDAMLKAVAERLRKCTGEHDMLARLGADEFAVLQLSGEQPFSATSLAGNVIDALDPPFELDGQQIALGVSIGIAVARAGSDADELLKNADLALHRAKAEGGRNYRFFEAGMDAEMQARCKLQFDLRKALANGEFELHYQPVVNLERNEISGMEALLRWHHPERGSVSPAVFIPVAEETGLILPIGEWVLRQACGDAAKWPEDVKVAVNLSPAQFRSPNLVQMVFAALAASGLPAGRLELEITESVLLHDNRATVATLHQLRSLGVRIAMDDFGTGYSSLGYLRSFPFDKIKIDRRFVKDLAKDDGGSLAILRAVSNLGSSLGMATTAEGVETQDQVEKVRAEGCTEMQGFFFSPPRPLKDIERLFFAQQQQRSATAA